MKKILAICGSTRASSTNLSLIYAIKDLAKEKFAIEIFEGLADIPHFNPDLDTEEPLKEVEAFRKLFRGYDGFLICTPEYAMGVPGSLKNLIDWTVSSMEFSKKPVALITASSVGEKGHQSLIGTLKVVEALITDETQLLISFAKTKIDINKKIIDEKTLEEVLKLIAAFEKIITENRN